MQFIITDGVVQKKETVLWESTLYTIKATRGEVHLLKKSDDRWYPELEPRYVVSIPRGYAQIIEGQIMGQAAGEIIINNKKYLEPHRGGPMP